MYPVGSLFRNDQKFNPHSTEKTSSEKTQKKTNDHIFKDAMADSREYQHQFRKAQQGLPTDFSKINFKL